MSELSRREFAEAIALATLTPFLGGAAAPVLLPIADASAETPAALAQALAGVIRAQYGERLSARQLATVTRQIEASLERAAKIRKVPLANGDEPDFVFSAVRAPSDG